MTPPLLQLEAVTMQFGGLRCLTDFSFSVGESELVGLIGPNGAGKTTVFNLITGVYQPTAGQVAFAGKSVIGQRPYRITARGIARTFQNVRLFSSLSVFDNVRTACNMHLRHGISHALVRADGFAREENEIESSITELLEIFGLAAEREHSCSGNEPDGEDRAHEAHPVYQGEIWTRRSSCGARHEGRHGHLRAHCCARLRKENRGRLSG